MADHLATLTAWRAELVAELDAQRAELAAAEKAGQEAAAAVESHRPTIAALEKALQHGVAAHAEATRKPATTSGHLAVRLGDARREQQRREGAIVSAQGSAKAARERIVELELAIAQIDAALAPSEAAQS